MTTLISDRLKSIFNEKEIANDGSTNKEIITKMSSHCNEFLKIGLEFQKKFN